MFSPLQPSRLHRVGLVILNQPIVAGPFDRLWQRAELRACADGGANRLYEFLGEDRRDDFIPNCIVGDLDSLRPEVREFYEKKGTKIVHKPSQDLDDLKKVIIHLLEASQRSPDATLDTIYVLDSLGARFDHIMSNVDSLFFFSRQPTRIVLVSASSYVLLLGTGSHTLLIAPWEGPTCGLLPVGGPCHAVTAGLKWNLSREQTLAFGELVSTSNAFVREGEEALHRVTLDTDAPVLWTAEIQWTKAPALEQEN